MALQNPWSDDYPRMDRVIRPTVDTVDVFFASYLMARYTIYMTTKEKPHETLEEALKLAVIACIVAALFTFSLIVVRFLETTFVAILLTALVAGAGTLCGLIGMAIFKAGLLCSGLAAVNVTQQIFGFGFPGLIGGIGGAIATGYKAGRTEQRATETISGIFFGIIVNMVAVLCAGSAGMLVAFLLIARGPEEENYNRNTDLIVIGLPITVCSSLSAAFAIWLCDGFALQVIDGLTELPNGFPVGAIIGVIIGFVFGSNFGYYECAQRNHETVKLVVKDED